MLLRLSGAALLCSELLTAPRRASHSPCGSKRKARVWHTVFVVEVARLFGMHSCSINCHLPLSSTKRSFVLLRSHSFWIKVPRELKCLHDSCKAGWRYTGDPPNPKQVPTRPYSQPERVEASRLSPRLDRGLLSTLR